MTDKQFEEMAQKITTLARKSLAFTKINEKVFEEFTIKQMRIVVTEAREIMKDQDLFLTADLYHIIGMADLTGAQMAKVLKLTKIITQARYYVKKISTIELPKELTIKQQSEYKSKFLKQKFTQGRLKTTD